MLRYDFFKKSKKKPLTREVYIMELDPSLIRLISGFFLKVRIIKIGISKNSNQRKKEVDSGIKGKIILIDCYLVEAATRTESHIHKLYKSDSFKPKVHKKGSGETEFFKLSNSQIQEIKSILSRRSANNSDFKKVFFLILFLIILFYYFLKFK